MDNYNQLYLDVVAESYDASKALKYHKPLKPCHLAAKMAPLFTLDVYGTGQ